MIHPSPCTIIEYWGLVHSTVNTRSLTPISFFLYRKYWNNLVLFSRHCFFTFIGGGCINVHLKLATKSNTNGIQGLMPAYAKYFLFKNSRRWWQFKKQHQCQPPVSTTLAEKRPPVSSQQHWWSHAPLPSFSLIACACVVVDTGANNDKHYISLLDLTFDQRVTQSCRLFGLTNSALV